MEYLPNELILLTISFLKSTNTSKLLLSSRFSELVNDDAYWNELILSKSLFNLSKKTINKFYCDSNLQCIKQLYICLSIFTNPKLIIKYNHDPDNILLKNFEFFIKSIVKYKNYVYLVMYMAVFDYNDEFIKNLMKQIFENTDKYVIIDEIKKLLTKKSMIQLSTHNNISYLSLLDFEMDYKNPFAEYASEIGDLDMLIYLNKLTDRCIKRCVKLACLNNQLMCLLYLGKLMNNNVHRNDTELIKDICKLGYLDCLIFLHEKKYNFTFDSFDVFYIQPNCIDFMKSHIKHKNPANEIDIYSFDNILDNNILDNNILDYDVFSTHNILKNKITDKCLLDYNSIDDEHTRMFEYLY